MSKTVPCRTLCVAFAILACVSPSPSPTPSPSPAPLPSPTSSGEAPAADYELSCRIRPVERQPEVEGTITLSAADVERPAIRLVLREDMLQPEVVVLAPEPCVGPAEVTPGPAPSKRDDPRRISGAPRPAALSWSEGSWELMHGHLYW